MNKLSKKNREITIFKGIESPLNKQALMALEQSQLTAENGFTEEAAAIASQLSLSANKYNELKLSGKKLEKIMHLLNEKIHTCISQLKELNYSVQEYGNGSYLIKPQQVVLQIQQTPPM